jgi:hypothetical protein
MTTLQQMAEGQANAHVVVNEIAESLSAAGVFSKRHAATSGLVWGYYGGLYNGNTKADGTVTLTDDADNYVVVLRSSGVVSTSTSATNSTDPLYAKLYKITTVSGAVTAAVDQRWDANGLLFAPGGTGGAEMMSGFIGAPADKTYKLVVKAAHGGTITEATTICVSGTCTATFKINTTALGGTANAVSSGEQSQAHSSANVFAAGDDLQLTVSSNSACTDMSFTLKYTRTV